ncbi:MAG: efflux RND transporter periplasmic adaptor subunit [Arenimonas sp.]|jgi:membrane fusion protein (multidrug efflux system)|uniref:efflux RND transporter periplasmic adaptor subunit n=1 Tax=Arenimonas sp. TaxID=1872635 RepID=UPI001B72315C|nr:efflux RND transporter periplasmic adaptor subunit [Arenimonas sp.]
MYSTFKQVKTAVLILVIALTLAACGGKPDAANAGKAENGAEQDKRGKDGKPAAPEAVPVEVVTASSQSINASYAGTANLEAPNEAQVVAKSSGVMVAQLAEEGDSVRQGQVLARIDPARAQLEVQRSQATVNKLSNNFARAQELRKQNLISAEAHDQIRFDLESAKASLNLARLELSYTNVTAPISGVIAQRMVKEGNLVTLNSPVFRIVNTQYLEAVMNVPERELALIKSGMPVRMIVDAVPGQAFEGRVDRVSPVMEAGSGTFRVTCAFDGKQILRPGMFGRFEIIYDRRENVLTIPRTALLEDETDPAVFVVRAGKAVRAPIKLGYSNGEIAEVVSGLKAGDRIITAGKVAVRDAATVTVIAIDGKAVAQPKNDDKKADPAQ